LRKFVGILVNIPFNITNIIAYEFLETHKGNAFLTQTPNYNPPSVQPDVADFRISNYNSA